MLALQRHCKSPDLVDLHQNLSSHARQFAGCVLSRGALRLDEEQNRRFMTTIRKFAYTTLLALTTLSFAPGQAVAQEPAQGKFTLSHDVHWGKALVPAGDYGFSFDPAESPRILALSKLSGPRAGFLIMVPFTEESGPSDLSRILLTTTSNGSYVSMMQLPEFGVTLDFDVPSHPVAKPIALTTTASAAQ
jgi:hypothetical protein